MGDEFVHLHTHTEYSILDGKSHIDDLVKRTVELGQPATAITDHGNLGGAYKLWKSATAAGIKPILGCEFYVAPGDRKAREPTTWGRPEQKDRDIGGGGKYTHLTVIAKNTEGWTNLCRLSATASTDGFYGKPRIDKDILGSLSSGLIVLSGCVGGEINTRLRLGQWHEAVEVAGFYKQTFKEDFFIEVMAHGSSFDEDLIPLQTELADLLRIPLVATNDSHYVNPEEHDVHDAMLCIQTKARISDSDRFRFDGRGYFLRNRSEMDRALQGYATGDACKNTLVIAERVEDYSTAFERRLRLPSYSDDPDYDLSVWVWDELDRKKLSTEYSNRANFELDIIQGAGFSNYILLLADLLQKARARAIRIGPGRGSSGGCVVAYVVGITAIDPIREGLLFERFLNPERISLPDIDVDIADDRRDEFLGMVRQQFGEEYVAQLGTYGTIKAKAAIHDSARVLGYSRYESNSIVAQLPPAKFGVSPTLDSVDWEATGFKITHPEVIETAFGIENTLRSQGIHAAGVIISPEPIAPQIPLYRKAGKGGAITSFDMDDITELGFVKYDFLGVSTLGGIDACLQMLLQNGRSIPTLPVVSDECTDKRTFELLQSGNTLGVFQLDSPGMQQLLRSIRPDHFGDISAVLALYRPGPMGVNAHHSYARRKNGGERISYPHSDLEKPLRTILADTHGVVVYQEQLLEILKEVCGYTYATAATIFKAMTKKDTQKMAEAKPDFYERMKSRGYSDEAADALWEVLEPFALYSFNKSHTVGYGLVAYWTAFLKANYPTYWMCALLTKEEKPEKIPTYLGEVTRMGIPILRPDINHSDAGWTPTDEGIRYGISTIKGIGKKVQGMLFKFRPYRSLHDFFERTHPTVLNVSVLRALIQSGSLDTLCPYREELWLSAPELAERATAERTALAKGQGYVVEAPYRVDPAGCYNRTQRIQWEEEVLGVRLTQRVVGLRSATPLYQNDFLYIKKVMDAFPGLQRVYLRFGSASIYCGTMELNTKSEKSLKGLGSVIIEVD